MGERRVEALASELLAVRIKPVDYLLVYTHGKLWVFGRGVFGSFGAGKWDIGLRAMGRTLYGGL